MTCPCNQTALEILRANIDVQKPAKSILIIDTGSGWEVTPYGPDHTGLGSDHVTIQSALDDIEAHMVRQRRSTAVETAGGETITEPHEILRALRSAPAK